MPDVFLAHASPDKPLARQLFGELKKLGVSTFLDEEDRSGVDWDLRILAELKNSRLAVVMVSRHYDRAFYLREEVHRSIALTRQEATQHHLLPLFLEGIPSAVDMPYGLGIKPGWDWRAKGGAAGVAAEIAAMLSGTTYKSVIGEGLPAPAPAELDQDQRYDVLCALLPGQFAEILFKMTAPIHQFPSDYAPLSLRALSMVQWVQRQPDQSRRRFDSLLRKAAPGLLPG
ncbi:MAG TPA: toll/interleukin-1 receptor domain-containing protein [Myxococcota bacterium]|nr:toll/interleukin-1 receptor domain-containing protein [Myxococcota bacterium]